MNSDPSQPAPAPANHPSASPRTSNLKSRWKRAPSGSAVSQRAATPSVCGEVTDVTSARESLSGQHVKGYERAEAPPPRPAPAFVPPPPARPVAAPTELPPSAKVESSAETHWSEPQSYDAPTRPLRAEAAPVRQAPPPPAPRVESASANRPPPREFSSAPPRPREASTEPRREPLPPRSRETSSEPRRESAPPPRPPGNRPPPDGRGERDHYVALKPDPANDAAPRRLRTEAPQQIPVQEYTPSAFGRGPDKSIPVRRERERESSRRESDSRSSERERQKPDAVIPARVTTAEPVPKAKSGGILGFIKRIFTGDPVPVKVVERSGRDREDDSHDGRRSERDHRRNDDDGRHSHDRRHHRHRGGQNRQSSQGERRGEQRGDHRGERRGDRRPGQG